MTGLNPFALNASCPVEGGTLTGANTFSAPDNDIIADS